MSRRFLPLMKKETLHILRDPLSLYLAIGLPIVLLILFGSAITLDVNNIPVGIIDMDRTEASRDFISEIESSRYFDLRHNSTDYAGTDKLLDDGVVKVIVVIPDDFSRDLGRGKDSSLQLLVDGSDNNFALIAMGYLVKVIQSYSASSLAERMKRIGAFSSSGFQAVDVHSRIWYNPDLRSKNFVIPGLIATLMMILSTMLTSLTVAREWETGTMEQLMATPARGYEIIIGKLTPYFFLGLTQITLVVLIGTLIFRVPLKGSILFLFLVSGIFLVCGLSLGLFISTVTKSQQLSFMFSVIFSLLPSFLLSGFIFPISSMPKLIRFVTHLVPARYFLVVLRGIFLKGNGIEVLWPQVLVLVLMSLVFILACAKKMKLSLE